MIVKLGLTPIVQKRMKKIQSYGLGGFDDLTKIVRVGICIGGYNDYPTCHLSIMDVCDRF